MIPRADAGYPSPGRGNAWRFSLARLWQIAIVGLMAAWAVPVSGVERFPPPEFEATYKMPATTTPPARAQGMEYVDVAVLLGALSAASYLSLVKRRRSHLLVLSLFSLLYFGFYRKGCICPVGSIQDVVLALGNQGYAVPFTVLAFFFLPLIFTLFFARGFCAAVCPLGAIQDVVVVKPVKVPNWLEQGLSIIPFVYLGLAVLLAATGSAFLICQFDPFVAFFRRSGSAGMLVLGIAFLLVGLFFGRPYCRIFCPYGAILRVLSFFSKWNVTLTPNDCLRCEICDVACPYGAIREPAQAEPSLSTRAARVRLALLILLIPLLIGGLGWLGSRLGVPLSKLHKVVSLAEQVAMEDANPATPPTDASKAFRQTGRPVNALLADALRIRRQLISGGWVFGGFVGLVMGIKLASLFVPKNRTVWEPDEAACLSCGRCFTYCPKELVRAKKVQRKNAIPLKPV